MASKGIEQRHLFLLHQSVILSVIDYGLGLTTLSQSNLLKLDRVQNEAMRVILGTTKDTPIETIRDLLDLSSMETRHKVEQVKAYLNAMQNPKNPLHDAVKEEKGCGMARGKSWMGQAEQSIQHVCTLTELKQVRDWEKMPSWVQALLQDAAVREPRHTLPWMASWKKTMQTYKCLSKPTASHMTSWSTQTAQSQGTGLVGSSQSSRVEGLCTKTVEPTESRPVAWPWR